MVNNVKDSKFETFWVFGIGLWSTKFCLLFLLCASGQTFTSFTSFPSFSLLLGTKKFLLCRISRLLQLDLKKIISIDSTVIVRISGGNTTVIISQMRLNSLSEYYTNCDVTCCFNNRQTSHLRKSVSMYFQLFVCLLTVNS